VSVVSYHDPVDVVVLAVLVPRLPFVAYFASGNPIILLNMFAVPGRFAYFLDIFVHLLVECNTIVL
jgi:hypothetical protein